LLLHLELAGQSINCKKPLVLIKEEEDGTLCMAVDALMIRFTTCNSLDTLQQWLIFKTENDRNNIRLCQRWGHWNVPIECLTALSPFPPNYYRMFHQISTIKPSNEARELSIRNYDKSDPSQHWLVNSTTHQLASVPHPKSCATTRHFLLSRPFLSFITRMRWLWLRISQSTLSTHQRFYQTTLDKNGEQLCLD